MAFLSSELLELFPFVYPSPCTYLPPLSAESTAPIRVITIATYSEYLRPIMKDGPIALGKKVRDISDFNAVGETRLSMEEGKLAAGFIPRKAANRAPEGGIWEIATAICVGSPIDWDVCKSEDGSFCENTVIAIEKNIAILIV